MKKMLCHLPKIIIQMKYCDPKLNIISASYSYKKINIIRHEKSILLQLYCQHFIKHLIFYFKKLFLSYLSLTKRFSIFQVIFKLDVSFYHLYVFICLFWFLIFSIMKIHNNAISILERVCVCAHVCLRKSMQVILFYGMYFQGWNCCLKDMYILKLSTHCQIVLQKG